MKYRTYAMDTHFMCDNSGPSATEQVLMVKEAGFDDYYFTGAVEKQKQFEETLAAAKAAGLGFSAAFQQFDVGKAPTLKEMEGIETVISKLSQGARLEIALTCGGWAQNMGNAACDALALAWLRPISDMLERYGIEGSLYPHFNYYLETLSDALRLARAMDHGFLKVIFCGYHWYRVGKEPHIASLLADANSHLNAVNLCGSRHLDEERDVKSDLNPTIEPLDSGTLDNKAILDELCQLGFSGPVGIQGYGVNAPAQEALHRSRKALAELIANRC